MKDQEEAQRILEAASKRFFEFGISKVTVDELAVDLGMSKKTIYKYFASKDDLLLALVRMNIKRIGTEVDGIVDSDQSFERKMTALLLIIGRQIRRLSPQFQIDMQRLSPALWKEIETFRRERVIARLKEMFVQAQKEKYFRDDLDIEIFHLVLLKAAEGIVNPLTLYEHSFSAAKAFQEIIKILFEGALTADGREHIKLTFSDSHHQLLL